MKKVASVIHSETSTKQDDIVVTILVHDGRMHIVSAGERVSVKRAIRKALQDITEKNDVD